MIKLRKLEPEDIPYLYQWENDAKAWSDGANHNPLSQHDLRAYIGSTVGDIYRDGQLRLVVCLVQANLFQSIGVVDLFDFDPRNLRAAVGLYIAPEYRGCNYAKETFARLEEYAFGFLHLRTMYATVSVHNVISMRMHEEMGYIRSSNLSNWTLEGDAVIFIKNNNHIIKS